MIAGKPTLRIIASYVAEPIEKPLRFLFEESGMELDIEFAGFNQIYREALDPESEAAKNEGVNLFLIRAEDLSNQGDESSPGAEFSEAVEALSSRSSSPIVVVFGPSCSGADCQSQLEQAVAGRLEKVRGVTAILSETLEADYPVQHRFDPEAEAASSIPYTDEMYAAIALKVTREVSRILRKPAKLIVLDADNTLWGGVAGEDGPGGLTLDGPWLELGEAMAQKHEQGFLLALASKNNEEDLAPVFQERADELPLSRDQFVGWKANWKPKSENILELAEELNLGVDSFIFIDDNPAEVAEVIANCPGITAVCLPEDPADIPGFIANLWCLDGGKATSEDSLRTQFYQNETARRELRNESSDFATFLEKLELKVSIDSISNSDYSRVSQLSLRTNQFNANPERLSDSDIAAKCSGGSFGFTVDVSDRFGQYGLVGACLCERDSDMLRAELFMLSCRAMGKGVEREMVRALGREAKEKGCSQVLISYRDSGRNEPCRLFLESIDAVFDKAGQYYRLQSDAAAELPLIPKTSEAAPIAKRRGAATGSGPQWNLEGLVKLATQWSRPSVLKEHLQSARRPRPEIDEPFIKPGTDLQRAIASIWEEVLQIDGIGVEDTFVSLGGGSLEMALLHAKLQRRLNSKFELSELFTLPTVSAIAEAIRRDSAPEVENNETVSTSDLRSRDPGDMDDQVAIVGMSLRIPGADDPDELWTNLSEGRESISRFEKEDLAYPEEYDRPDFVPAKGIIKDIEMFDAAFFGILPKDAKIMDPQQRIFLELAWEAMERAGYQPDNHRERIGVYAGAYFDTYLLANLCTDQKFLNDLIPQIQVGSLQTELGNDKDYLATRVAFKLNLKGPAMTLQTACSTSMVAIAEACRSIREGLCDMALAGGVTVTLPYKRGYFYTEQGMLSGDGHCRAFDEKASGTVFANGAGVVMLKRLSDAVRDRDHIHAVIRGTGMNNDGGVKHSYTAPSVDGQVGVIRMAHEDAGITPDTVTAIEAHGTGTPMGDPIEVTALTKAFREAGVKENQYCAIGSLKTNVGHLDVASGVCGVIKTALSLENKALPPLLHFQKANPNIDFKNSPFFPNAELKPWEKLNDETPRRAGVSSFGVGGTNVHTVMEEAPGIVSDPSPRDAQLIVLSARTESALSQVVENLANHTQVLEGNEKLEDAAWTLAIGRKPFRVRRAVVASDLAELQKNLRSEAPVATVDRSDPPVNFMFPGQGSQHVNMARDFYQSEPRFRDLVDHCSSQLEPHLGLALTDVLFPEEGSDLDAAADLLKNTTLAQPSIFVIEYALADLWMDWGVSPKAMIGHSVGEFVAACHAGVFTLEEGLELLASRGRLMGELPGGGMLSVRLDEEALLKRLPETLDLAAVNSPGLCVVAGPHHELERFADQLAKDDIVAKPLHTSHAFHSRMMDPVISRFESCFEKVDLRAPELPIFSTVTGEWLTPEEATNPRYWAEHLRETVRFSEAVSKLGETEEAQVFVEVGPGQTLCGLGRQSVSRDAGHRMVSTCLHVQEEGSDQAQMLRSLGRLWMDGVEIDWEAFYSSETRKRIPLPTYPFERKRHWVDPVAIGTATHHEAPVTNETQNFPDTNTAQTEPDMSKNTASRNDALASAIREILTNLSGIPEEELTGRSTYLELGFDSLLLTQVSKAFNDEFGTSVKMRELMTELSSIDSMVSHLDETLPEDRYREDAPGVDAPGVDAPLVESPVSAQAAPVSVHPTAPVVQPLPAAPPGQLPAAVTPVLNTAPVPVDGSVQSLIAQQMNLMQQQLGLLQGGTVAPLTQNHAQVPVVATPETPVKETTPEVVKPAAKKEEANTVSSAPSTKIDRDADDSLTQAQQRHLDELIAKYTTKTSSSKSLTDEYRQWYADPRTVSGFNRLWKEMIYQIVVKKSKGSRLLDIDGNEYIDMLNGFGPGFLGHSPDRITETLHAQLDRGVEVGPQCQDAMEAAKLFCELTGNERCSFVNTGSEAVQAAMRMTRTVTGRDKIVVFTKDYHGNFDEVLVRGVGSGDKLRSMPVAPGIPNRAVDDVIVLDYGTDEALEVIRARGKEIAAVIIEPIQSRRPEFQPREFIHEVRKITNETGSAFVFDEVITGFRTGPRGAQEYFGVEADVATYGKVVGAGMPVGVVAGKAEFMDTFDGGQWQYGDDSFPEQGVTFFAGTFVRHPLAMAAVKEMLLYLKECGPELWVDLKAKANRLSTTVDRMFVENNIPFRMPNFGSQMFVRHIDDNKYANLLFFHLREKGVFLLEGFPSYMTIAHTDEDVDYVIEAFRESIAEMQDAGFFPKPAAGSAVKLNGKRLTGPERLLSNDGGVDKGSADRAVEKKKHRDDQRCYPLTEPVAEIWLASKQGDDVSRCYNEINELKFSGPLDVEALRASLQEVVNRHDALRAVFLDSGEGFKINGALDLEVPCTDLSSLQSEKQERRYEEELDIEREHIFDLENGPLFRARIVQLGANEHSLILNAHHLICDGWSYNLLTVELGELYSATLEERVPNLAPSRSLKLYALSQVQDEKLRSGGESEAYWLSKFEEPIPPLNFPTPKGDEFARSLRGDRIDEVIDADLLNELRATARQSGSTLFSILLGAFQILLGRVGGQKRVATFFPVAGQLSGEGLENTVGHFVNTLPVISDFDPDQSITEYVGSVQARVLDAMEYQDFTYGRLLKLLPHSKRPDIDSIFNLETMEGDSGFAGVSIDISEAVRRYTSTPITLNVLDKKDSLELQFGYQSDRFPRELFQSWTRSYVAILRQIVETPTVPVDRIGSAMQTADLDTLVRWSVESTGSPDVWSVPDHFEAAVNQNPEKVAIASPERNLTYRDLSGMVDAIASSLGEVGVSAGDAVAVFLEQSPERIASVLAVLKTGAAYVPVDPAYPRERIAFMLEDSGASVVISQNSLLSSVTDLEVECLDVHTAIKGGQSGGGLLTGVEIDGETPAYVIYTSGSTGTPKGAVIPHRGIVRLVKHANYCDLGEDETILQAASICFDASTFEIFGALLNGGTLALPASGELTLASLAEAIGKHQVTTLWLTSGLFQLMVEEDVSVFSGVRQLLTGGDVVPVGHASAVKKAHPQLRLINGYGPTENTTFTTTHEISNRDLKGASIPIGRPVSNTSVWILDPEGRPLPPGVAGELCCGGDGLALEYLNQDELTEERFFIANPSGKEEVRLYRTGDLCRFRGDGVIEFLGRIDHQIKIRGFRVEPEEIENRLAANPLVGQCKVVARGEGAGEKQLVAYVSPLNGHRPGAEMLRSFLVDQLPSYMVPGRFLVLDELPLTVNGKIDSNALPLPEDLDDQESIESDPVGPPQSECEIKLARIWKSVLKLDQVDLGDHFFELGGHSLLGMKLIARMQKEFGLQVPLSVLIKFPLLGDLAAEMDRRQGDSNRNTERGGYQNLAKTTDVIDIADAVSETTVILQPEGDNPPLFGVHGGDGGVFFYQDLATSIDNNRPFYAFEAAVLTSGGEIQTEPVEKTAARYVGELKKVQKEGPYHLCGYSFGGVVAYEMACQLSERGDEVAFLGLIDTWNPDAEIRRRSLSERIGSNWSALTDEGEGVISRASQIGKHMGTGLGYKLKFSTQEAVAKSLPTSKSTGWIRQVQVRFAYDVAMTDYHPPGYEGDMVLIKAQDEKHKWEDDGTYGWKGVVDGKVTVVSVPGNHISMFHRENVNHVSSAMRKALDESVG